MSLTPPLNYQCFIFMVSVTIYFASSLCVTVSLFHTMILTFLRHLGNKLIRLSTRIPFETDSHQRDGLLTFRSSRPLSTVCCLPFRHFSFLPLLRRAICMNRLIKPVGLWHLRQYEFLNWLLTSILLLAFGHDPLVTCARPRPFKK